MQISLAVQKVSSFRVGLQKQDPIKAHTPHLMVVFKVHVLIPSPFIFSQCWLVEETMPVVLALKIQKCDVQKYKSYKSQVKCLNLQLNYTQTAFSLLKINTSILIWDVLHSTFSTILSIFWKLNMSKQHKWKVEGTRSPADASWALHFVDMCLGQNATEDTPQVSVCGPPNDLETCMGRAHIARCWKMQARVNCLHSQTGIWGDERAARTASVLKSTRNTAQMLLASLLSAHFPGGPENGRKMLRQELPSKQSKTILAML